MTDVVLCDREGMFGRGGGSEAYLLGISFQLVMDHKALLALGRRGARIIRWALALQPF